MRIILRTIGLAYAHAVHDSTFADHRPAGEIDQEIAENMVELLGDESAINLVLTSDAMAGGDALQQLIEGRADVALISNDQPFRDDIATVMPLYATVLHVVYPNDRDPESFIDLMRNALVFAGQPGSASRRVFERLTSTVELGDEGFRFETGTAADVDLAVVFAPIAPDRLAEYPDVQLWSIGKPEDIGRGGPIDSLVLLNPHFRPFVIPVGTYGDAAADPVVTIAVDKLIIARSDLDRSVVYQGHRQEHQRAVAHSPCSRDHPPGALPGRCRRFRR